MKATCPLCGAVTHNEIDIKKRYCGKCHKFYVIEKEFTREHQELLFKISDWRIVKRKKKVKDYGQEYEEEHNHILSDKFKLELHKVVDNIDYVDDNGEDRRSYNIYCLMEDSLGNTFNIDEDIFDKIYKETIKGNGEETKRRNKTIFLIESLKL